MFRIDDENKKLIKLNSDGTETILYTFLNISLLQDPKYTLYAYAEVIDNKLYIKFGEAKDQTIYARYHRGTATKANDRMIAIWESNKRDKEIHNKLEIRYKNNRGYKPATKEILNTIEAYEVETERGLTNLLADIKEYAESTTPLIKVLRPDYADIVKLVNEVININKVYYIADLCTRYGKTGFFSLLFKEYNKLGIRFNILASYVGTVKTSYSDEINTLENNKNCLFVDPDTYSSDKEIKETINSWLSNPDHYVCYYVALTGDEDTCFDRRTKVIKELKSYNKSMVIEEADFGAGCDKQIKKIKNLFTVVSNNFKHFFATTGTKADKCERIFEPEIVIKRDYILDVLNKRTNAVGINWYTLNNSEMVRIFNYTSAEMENFNNMFELKNNKLKGEVWFRDVINFLFNKQLPVINKDTRKYRDHNLLNDTATMIFTVNSKEAQQALKDLVKTIVGPSYLVKIINGDETTNAKAEAEAKQAIKDWGTKVIFIASGMANRSFSIPEIKNIILFCNAGLPDQKIARCLTPWKLHPELKGNIIDFRLIYEQTNLSNYLSNIAVESLAMNATHPSTKQLLEEIEATDKLTFFEYFSAGIDPIRKLTADELKQQMHSRDYQVARALKIVYTDLATIDVPNEKFSKLTEKLDFNELASSNIKGDNSKKVYLNRTIKSATGKNEKELTEDQRINYLAYLLNHKDEFNSGKYETNILENEFKNNMSTERKLACENTFNLDMNVISQIAALLIKNNIKIYN